MIIGIYGKKRHGKDTIANFLCNKYGFVKYGFGDPIKEIARIIFGFTDEQLYGNKKEEIDPIWNIKPRDFFQKFGTDYGQFIFPEHFPSVFNETNTRDIWVKLFVNWYTQQKKINPFIKVVVNDIRFIHEYEAIKELDGYIIKVHRDVFYSDSHLSESELDGFNEAKFNSIILNNRSKEHLYNQIISIIN
jgi:hypothetical protein